MTTFAAPPVRTDFGSVTSAELKQPAGVSVSRPWVQWFAAIAAKLSSAPPTVTGSRGGNVALTNLLAALNAAGVVIDNTTP